MDVTAELLAECKKLESLEPSPRLRELTGKFLGSVLDSADPTIPSPVIAELASLPPIGAAWLAITFGVAVEKGASPNESANAIAELLRNWLKSLPYVDEETDDEIELPELDVSQQQIVDGMQYLCQSSVAHIARVEDLRASLADDQELHDLLNNASYYGPPPLWVKTLLERRSGELILIHPGSKRCFKVAYQNVGNCFHLFSLIQHVLGDQLPEGRTPDKCIADVALGKSDEEISDSAWWHYGNALLETPELASSIWGEGSTLEIPSIDGQQIIILWPPIMEHRGWDAGFLTPRIEAAPSGIHIEAELTPEQSKALLERLNIKPEPLSVEGEKTKGDKPWWKIW